MEGDPGSAFQSSCKPCQLTIQLGLPSGEASTHGPREQRGSLALAVRLMQSPSSKHDQCICRERTEMRPAAPTGWRHAPRPLGRDAACAWSTVFWPDWVMHAKSRAGER